MPKFLPRTLLSLLLAFSFLCLGSLLRPTQAQLPNVYEQVTQVDAAVPVDMDGDGVYNWWELLYGFDPLDPSDAALDPDGDGLSNLLEFHHLTNPLRGDTDGGSVWDKEELGQCNNPLDPSDDRDGDNCYNHDVLPTPKDPRGDSDGDGLSNDLEDELGTDKHSIDTDEDGVNDNDEVYKFLTNPLEPDSDLDGISDYDEIFRYFIDPNNRDSDFDGLTDAEEIFTYGTNPTYWDSDESGMSDFDEINNGSDPNKQGDDFQFTWTIYFGSEFNDLYKTLENSKIDMYQGMGLTIEAVKPVEAKRISVRFNDQVFDTEKEYIKLKLLSPEKPGIYTIELILNLESGQVIRMTRFVELKQKGKIVSKIEGTFSDVYANFDLFENKPEEGAKIEVFVYNETFGEMQLYQSDIFDIANPQYTDANGEYLIALHPGNYLIKISKPEIGTKEILYSTEKYAIFSRDVNITYDYDIYVWGGIFVSTFISVWLFINFMLLSAHITKILISNIFKPGRIH